MLLLACGFILALVILAVSSPFWRKDPDPLLVGQDADQNQEQVDLAIERDALIQSLQELEVELAQGRMAPQDYERLKATDERQLLHVLDRLEVLTSSPPASVSPASSSPAPTFPWVGGVVTALVVLVSSSGIYLYMHWRQNQALETLQTRLGSGTPNPLEMVAKLEARLRSNPNDLKGQILAGRSYVALERTNEAKQAWSKVLELDPRNYEAHYNLGVLLIETRKFDDPELFQAALSHFDKALVDVPMEPAVNWYRGLALWYLKRHQETDAAWTTAFQNLKPGSKDAEYVKTALGKLRAGQVPF